MTIIKRPKIERAIDELWLPPFLQRKPAQPPNFKRFMGHYPCPDCCEKNCSTCTCEECATDSPFYAPCCWKVVIAGIVDGSCSDCEVLNKTYYLSQDDSSGCTWSEGAVCGDCDPANVDPSDITLTVSLDGSDYIITVTMGGHIWKKNYGTSKPECCELNNEAIAHLTDSGDCDSSSATCVITALSDGHPCVTEQCACPDDECINPVPELVVDFGVLGFTDTSRCDFCDQLGGEYVLTRLGNLCRWTFSQENVCTVPQFSCAFSFGQVDLFIQAELQVVATDVRWRVRMFLQHVGVTTDRYMALDYFSDFWDEGLECMNLADPSDADKIPLTFFIDGGTCTAICTGTPPTTIKLWDAAP